MQNHILCSPSFDLNAGYDLKLLLQTELVALTKERSCINQSVFYFIGGDALITVRMNVH